MMSSEQPLDNSVEEEDREKVQSKTVINGSIHKLSNGNVLSDQKDINQNIEVEVTEKSNINNNVSENKLEKDSSKLEENGNIDEAQTEKTEEILVENNSVLNTEILVDIKEELVTTTTHQEVTTSKTVITEKKKHETLDDLLKDDSQEDFEELERRIEAEEALAVDAEIAEKTQDLEEEESGKPEGETLKADGHVHTPDEDIPDHIDSPDSLETIEIPDGDDFEHYTVLDGRSKHNGDLTQDTNGHDIYYSEETNGNHDISSHNGESEEKTFDDHFVLDTRETISPIGDEEKKDSSDKKTRIHTLGVQKTEQPYSTCTTETKIAMEIREMREREEELKTMRERQAQIPVPPPQHQPQKKIPFQSKFSPVQKPVHTLGYTATSPNHKAISTPGYRVSSVFGNRGISQQGNENKFNKNVNKESAVEKEIRLAKDREEELRKQKGLPPREDDSYVKPSQVKSSQARAFGKIANAENSRLIATAKIQNEIQEQTMREIALRESGHIQTLSSERTDSKVTKLKTLDLASPECTSPTHYNGNGYTNGSYSNGHISPDSICSKRSTPSPTGSNYSINRSFGSSNSSSKGLSIQKFSASRGKETTFTTPRNGPFHPKTDTVDAISGSAPEPGKLKRTESVESKIQQEILDMKLREDELKLLHTDRQMNNHDNGFDDVMPKSPIEYHQNGGDEETEEVCPRRSNLIAQWEQRIQKSEGKV